MKNKATYPRIPPATIFINTKNDFLAINAASPKPKKEKGFKKVTKSDILDKYP
jgi:hypothetical protein